MSKLEKHLGGHNHKTHIDTGALKWLKGSLGCKSLCDLGCGPGGMIEEAVKLGYSPVIGLDGDHTLKRTNKDLFILHDFTKGTVDLPEEQYDVCWCVEFVEHVYEEFIPNYVDVMQKCKYVVMTHAPVGWNGHHHVNCQDQPYWVDMMNKFHLEYSEELTKQLHSATTMNIKNPRKSFVKNTGLVLKNAKL